METQQIITLIVGVILLGAFMFWPQYRAKQRRKKLMSELSTGDEVMTIGGIIGRLTYLNREESRARIEVSPGVEVEVALTAVSRSLSSFTQT